MILIPNCRKSRIKREAKRLFYKLDAPGWFTHIATIVGILSFFGGVFNQAGSAPLYYLVGLSMLLMSHYSRRYFSEKAKNDKSHNLYSNLHRSAESIREIMLNITGSIDRKSLRIGTPEWAKEYHNDFKNECHKICENIVEAFNSIGYPVNHACIKFIDHEKGGLHVISRSDPDRILTNDDCSDDFESFENNPFYKILIETHTDYATYSKNPEVLKIKRNLKSDCPKFLAIGSVDQDTHPVILSTIINNYFHRAGTQRGPEGHDDKSVKNRFRERAKDKYRSCLGMMISEKHKGKGNVSYNNCRGFIGVDSVHKDAWEFLDPSHLHFLASIADSIFGLLIYYQQANKMVEGASTHES